MNELDEQLYFSKLSQVKEKYDILKENVDQYTKDADELLSEIEEITEIENIQRVAIIKVKEKYRTLKNNYESVKYKIDEFVPTLGEGINALEEEFIELENLMNDQQYKDSKDKCDALDAKIDFLAMNVRDLPTYVSIAHSFIPKRFDDIEKRMHEMNEKGFALDKLEVSKRFDGMREDLEIAIEDMKALNIESVGDKLEHITSELNNLVRDLDIEEASMGEFLDIRNGVFKKIQEVHEDYKYAVTEYKKLEERYILSDPELVVESSYPELERILDETKDLETEINEKNFAYRDMVEQLKSMQERTEQYEKRLKYFFEKRDQFYMTEQRAVDELDSINIVLLEIKAEIKNEHLPSISNEYLIYIDEAYKRAAAIQEMRTVKPMNLEVLSKKADEARDIIYKLYENVHHLIVTAQMVEETIVYGNRYRNDFMEVNNELTRVELLFRNGEYSEALRNAVNIIERVEPGFHEQLTEKD